MAGTRLPVSDPDPSMRVLLLMSNTGGGHRAAAEALAAELSGRPGVSAVVRDVIADLGGAWGHLTGLYGPLVRQAPWAYGAIYKAFDGPRWNALQKLVFRTVRPRLWAYVEQHRPDVAVSTHPLINHGMVAARDQWLAHSGQRVPVCTVITDPTTFHPSWIAPGADAWFCATAQAAQRAVELGAPADRVHVEGFPVHPRFTVEGPVWSHGAPAGTPVVLLCGGGEGLRRMPALAQALLDLPAQPLVLAVTGRDAAAQLALSTHAAERKDGRLQVFGFTSEMPALMRAAHVVVQKAGPGMLYEAMALRRPVVVVDAVPGQEEGNLALVAQEGVGRVALGSVSEAAEAVGLLLQDEPLRQRAALAGARLCVPGATARMVQRMVALAPPGGA